MFRVILYMFLYLVKKYYIIKNIDFNISYPFLSVLDWRTSTVAAVRRGNWRLFRIFFFRCTVVYVATNQPTNQQKFKYILLYFIMSWYRSSYQLLVFILAFVTL